MTWQDVEQDAARLGEDARRMIDDAVRVGEDLERQVTLAGQEVVTAEYLATENLLEWVSGWAEDGASLLALNVRQWRYLMEDGLSTLEAAAAARSARELAEVPGSHLRRRAGHLREGFDDARALATRGLRRSTEPLGSLWRPFLAMLRNDWGGR
jgi:hypothetical protein